MIDNEFVKDVSNVKVDSSYILRCETLTTKDFKYLQNVPSLTILNIKTRSAANMEKENQIYIRGKETAAVGK